MLWLIVKHWDYNYLILPNVLHIVFIADNIPFSGISSHILQRIPSFVKGFLILPNVFKAMVGKLIECVNNFQAAEPMREGCWDLQFSWISAGHGLPSPGLRMQLLDSSATHYNATILHSTIWFYIPEYHMGADCYNTWITAGS